MVSRTNYIIKQAIYITFTYIYISYLMICISRYPQGPPGPPMRMNSLSDQQRWATGFPHAEEQSRPHLVLRAEINLQWISSRMSVLKPQNSQGKHRKIFTTLDLGTDSWTWPKGMRSRGGQGDPDSLKTKPLLHRCTWLTGESSLPAGQQSGVQNI